MRFKSDVGSSPPPFKRVVMWTPALGALLETRMNRKIISIFLTGIIFLFSCNAKSVEPDLNYLLPTESKYMILLDNDSKKNIINKCSSELKKVEKENVFSINDLRKYYVYEEKIGSDEFIWFISPLFDKGVSVPSHQIILLRKKNDTYKILSKYQSQIIWGDIHLCLKFTNIQIIKEKEKAKGFIFFENMADIKFKTSNDADGFEIKKRKGQYFGSCSGTYFRFNDEPPVYSIEQGAAYYPSEEWNSISIDASDYLWDEKAPLKYALCNAFDGNPATSFVENTEDDLFYIYIGYPKLSKKIALINGYGKTEYLYKKNNRIKEIANEFISESEISAELTDSNERFPIKDNTLKYQIFDYISNGYVFISQIYPGSDYNDTCLAEINFYTDADNWVFGDIDE